MQRTPPVGSDSTLSRYAPPQPAERPRRVVSPHGERTDPWYWLRNDTRDEPEVLGHLAAENRTCERWFAPLSAVIEQLKSEHAARVPPEDASVPVLERGWWYQHRYHIGADHPVYVRWRESGGAEELLFDAADAARGASGYCLGALEISPDSRWMALTEDHLGRRDYVLRIVDRATGETLPERIAGIDPDLVFLDDGSILYIQQEPQTLLGYRVMCHRPGTSPDLDTLLYEETDDAFSLSLERGRSAVYVYLHLDSTTTTEVRYLRADSSSPAFTVAIPRQRDHEYDLEDDGECFIVRTNEAAPDFRLISAPIETVADRVTWREIVPHRPATVLTDVLCFAQHWVVGERSLGFGRVRLIHRQTREECLLEAPQAAATLWLDINADASATFLRYAWGSLTQPTVRLERDLSSGSTRTLRVDPVQGGHHPEEYVAERRWVSVRDGTHVPVSLLRRRETPVNGTAPLLMTAYGAYGHAQPAVFDRSVLPLVDRGFVYAIAHVRGGDELGRAWYDAGRLLEKHHTFEDFIDIRRALVVAGDVDPDRCCALGASAGGLLIGVIANEAAAEFRALVAHVPFVDILTSMLDDELPLTTLEYEEWGNPFEDPTAYRYIERYSPYDNLRPRAYPALFATGGLHDSQVQYWESAKWVAKMRRCQTGDAPIMLRVNLDAGHGGVTGRYGSHEELALEQAFLIDLTAAPHRPLQVPCSPQP